MLEIIAVVIYVSRLIALAHSRGRSAAWGLGGFVVWALGSAVGWALFPNEPVLASFGGLPFSVAGALLYYRVVHGLDTTELSQLSVVGRGDNFPCPCCASLQTEDRSGHLVCHACHAGFG